MRIKGLFTKDAISLGNYLSTHKFSSRINFLMWEDLHTMGLPLTIHGLTWVVGKFPWMFVHGNSTHNRSISALHDSYRKQRDIYTEVSFFGTNLPVTVYQHAFWTLKDTYTFTFYFEMKNQWKDEKNKWNPLVQG